MSTRSTIALEYANGTVDQVYCHHDGYLSHNGAILMKNYMDPFKVEKMMDLGELSSLGTRLDNCTFYRYHYGEQGALSKRFANFDEYCLKHEYQEFEYILRNDGQWYVSTGGDYMPLAFAMRDEKETIDSEYI